MKKVRLKRSMFNQEFLNEKNPLIKKNLTDASLNDEVDYQKVKQSTIQKWSKTNDLCYKNNDTLAKVFFLIYIFFF